MATIKRERLEELYHARKLSQAQIAIELGVSRSRVGQLLKEHSVACRGYAEASANMNDQRTTIFTGQQEQLILGSMLGDANLHHWTMISNKKSKNILSGYRLTFAHSIKQLDYLTHKREVLGGSEIGERLSGHGAIIKHFAFCHTPSLRPYARLCLDGDHKKRVSLEWLHKLDWAGVAYWYMDDGSLIITKKKKTGCLHPLVQFHTESFSNEERWLLQEMLRIRFKLHTSTRVCNGDRRQLRIVSKHKHEVGVFLSKINDYIIPCMRHKTRWTK